MAPTTVSATHPVTLVTADMLGKGLTIRKSAYKALGYYNMLTPDGYSPKLNKGRARGYSSAIMHFAPAKMSGYNVCQYASHGCTAACLNTAGHGGINLDMNGLNTVQRARIARTLTYFLNRFVFVEVMLREITTHIRRATEHSMIPVVRPNGTSDLPWERIRLNDGRTLFETFPTIQFYDYTKHVKRALDNAAGRHPSNYSLTFSRSETNEQDCLAVLAAGGNVAVVFKICSCKRACKHEIPDGLTYLGYPVVNGDHDDLRFLDPKRVVVGLKGKGRAKQDVSGFVVDIADCASVFAPNAADVAA